MSRARRRAVRGRGHARRVPARARGGRGLRIPWAPLAIVVGIAIVVGLVVYLVTQTGQPAPDRFAAAARAEADDDPNLPGDWVNLPEIYGNAYPDNAAHVRRDVDYSDQGLPPVGGPHWSNTPAGCGTDPTDAPPFCGPVPAGFYTEPWDAESLVHNLEHSGVVVWYNTSDDEIIDELLDFAGDNSDRLLVVSPFPDMEEETIAITAWSRRLMLSVSEYDRDALQEFLNTHECRFDPEGFC